MPAFVRTIGIDYSGAETPTASLKGLRVYMAEGDASPAEVPPPRSPRKYWTRRGIAQWLVERLANKTSARSGAHRVPGRVARQCRHPPESVTELETCFREVTKAAARTQSVATPCCDPARHRGDCRPRDA